MKLSDEELIRHYLETSKFGGKSKFSTWIYSITYNYCIDLIRKKKKDGSIFSDEIENAPDLAEEVPDSALLEMEVKKLKVVLDIIPVGDKAVAVLLMKYQDEMSIKEISDSLDKSESAIKMKLKRAKHKAQKAYEDRFKQRPL